MKILAAGDFHNDQLLARKLAAFAKENEVDAVILNGDLVEDEEPHGIVGHFSSVNKNIFLIHGNHESAATTDFLSRKYGAHNLHEYSKMLGEIGIFGVGGANVGHTVLTDSEFFDTLSRSHEYIKHAKKKIMVTHIHPSGTSMEKLSQFVQGSAGVRKAIDRFQPDIMICGHVHEAEGIEEMIGKTRVINVGRKGKIIEL